MFLRRKRVNAKFGGEAIENNENGTTLDKRKEKKRVTN